MSLDNLPCHQLSTFDRHIIAKTILAEFVIEHGRLKTNSTYNSSTLDMNMKVGNKYNIYVHNEFITINSRAYVMVTSNDLKFNMIFEIDFVKGLNNDKDDIIKVVEGASAVQEIMCVEFPAVLTNLLAYKKLTGEASITVPYEITKVTNG